MAQMEKITQAIDEAKRYASVARNLQDDPRLAAEIDVKVTLAREELAALLAERDGLKVAVEAADGMSYRLTLADELLTAHCPQICGVDSGAYLPARTREYLVAYRAARSQVKP